MNGATRARARLSTGARRTRPPACDSSLEQLRERGAGEVALEHEPARAARLDATAVGGPVSTRDEDDRQLRVAGEHPLRHLEPVEIGELDVEEHERRLELDCELEPGFAVL